MRLFLAYILYIILQTGLNEFPRQATSQLFPSQCVYTRNENAQARKTKDFADREFHEGAAFAQKMLRKMQLLQTKFTQRFNKVKLKYSLNYFRPLKVITLN